MSEKVSRRKFTEEFKRQIVELYKAGKPTSEILREYDLTQSCLYRWLKKINATGSTIAKDNRTPMEEELIRLRKENQRLKMEVDILKQAALIIGQK